MRDREGASLFIVFMAQSQEGPVTGRVKGLYFKHSLAKIILIAQKMFPVSENRERHHQKFFKQHHQEAIFRDCLNKGLFLEQHRGGMGHYSSHFPGLKVPFDKMASFQDYFMKTVDFSQVAKHSCGRAETTRPSNVWVRTVLPVQPFTAVCPVGCPLWPALDWAHLTDDPQQSPASGLALGP